MVPRTKNSFHDHWGTQEGQEHRQTWHGSVSYWNHLDLNDNRRYLTNNGEKHWFGAKGSKWWGELSVWGSRGRLTWPRLSTQRSWALLLTASPSPPGGFTQPFKKPFGGPSDSAPLTLHIKATSAQSGSTKGCLRFKCRDTRHRTHSKSTSDEFLS